MNEWQHSANEDRDSPGRKRWEKQRREEQDAHRQRDPRQPYVYFIQAESGGPVKIGWTYNPERRLKALQSASPYRLVLRKAIPGTQRLESYLHQHYEGFRLEGEWFDPQADMPGCLTVDGLSTATWLDQEGSIKAFEQEAQDQRESRREQRQRQARPSNPARQGSSKLIEQIGHDMLEDRCVFCGEEGQFEDGLRCKICQELDE